MPHRHALAADRVWTFTIETTPPTVTSTSPANGATGVSRTANITATFSEAMDPATVNAGNVELRRPYRHARVESSVTLSTNGRTVTLNPTPTLAALTVYTLTIKGGAIDPRVNGSGGQCIGRRRVVVVHDATVKHDRRTAAGHGRCPARIVRRRVPDCRRLRLPAGTSRMTLLPKPTRVAGADRQPVHEAATAADVAVLADGRARRPRSRWSRRASNRRCCASWWIDGVRQHADMIADDRVARDHHAGHDEHVVADRRQWRNPRCRVNHAGEATGLDAKRFDDGAT